MGVESACPLVRTSGGRGVLALSSGIGSSKLEYIACSMKSVFTVSLNLCLGFNCFVFARYFIQNIVLACCCPLQEEDKWFKVAEVYLYFASYVQNSCNRGLV